MADPLAPGVLFVVELSDNCAVAGTIIGGKECWFAWGPFGLIQRVFASKWAAIEAVGFAMGQLWLSIEQRKDAEIDRRQMAMVAVKKCKRTSLENRADVAILKIIIDEKPPVFFIERVGKGMWPDAFESRKDANTLIKDVLSDIESAEDQSMRP